jgi:UDP-glucose 4-epimerase
MRVAVTGASGYTGQLLVAMLDRYKEVKEIIGVDVKEFPAKSEKLRFYRRDIRDPELGKIFGEHHVDTIVHLAFVVVPIHDRRKMYDINVNGTENLVRSAEQCGARKIVAASSTSVYGAYPENKEFFRESAPLRGNPGYQYSMEKIEMERLLRDFEKGNKILTILRMCLIVGPNLENPLVKMKKWKRIPMIRGHDPPMQFVHEDDVARAFFEAVVEDHPGVYNVVPDGCIKWTELAEISGYKLRKIPSFLAYPSVALLWKLHLASGPPSSLDYIRYRWTASNEKIKNEWKFVFRYSCREAVESFLECK